MGTVDRIVAIATQITTAGHCVGPQSTFDSLALDSLACIDFTVAVEDAFDVSITCAERVNVDTLAELASLVDDKLAAQLPRAA